MSGAFLSDLESLFGWVVEASWQASILAALVLLLKWALRGRLNPRWHHALWLLVVARLLLPILPESALSLFQFAPAPPPAIARTVREPIFASPPELSAAPYSPPTPAPPPHYPYSTFTVLALIWLTGALVLLILTWQVNRRFIRHVRNAPRITDPRLCHLAETARKELGVRRSPRIIKSAQVQSPAIMGLWSPTLILPAEVSARFSNDELRFIFLHEFAHLKRGDLFLQWLVALLQIVHWFNPVLWYAFRQMRIDREPATDALVLSRTGESQKESYGNVLVKLLEHHHRRHALPTLVGILEDKDQFKRRFLLIARFTRGAYGWSLLGLAIIGILAAMCLTKTKGDAAKGAPVSIPLPPQEVLIQSIATDDPAMARKALKDGANLNLETEYIHGYIDQNTPLYFAAEKGEFDLVRLFVEHGASVQPGKSTWTNPLDAALRNGFPAIAAYLHDHGGTADHLVYAAGTGDLNQLTKLIAAGKPKNLDEAACTAAGCGQMAGLAALLGDGANAAAAFQRAASTGCVESIRYLLGHRVDIKAAGYEALCHAAYNNKTEATALLLKVGVNPNRQKQPNDTRFTDVDPPLNQAARAGALGSAKLLLEAGADPNSIVMIDPGYGGAGNTPLCDACTMDSDGVARLLLDHGAGLETVTSRGFTPLLYAAYSHAPKCLALFTDRGANMKAWNAKWKLGVLDFATIFVGEDSNRQGIEMPTTANINQCMATVQVLLDRGIDVNSSGREGHSLLYTAILNGQTAWTEMLLQHGANVNAVDHKGGTPLSAAMDLMGLVKDKRYYAVLDELLARGADPNLGIDKPAIAKDLPASPLKIALSGMATKERQRKTLEILLAHGARFPVPSGSDAEKMLLAATTGDTAAVSRLLAKGVSPDVEDSKGWTPLLSAAALGYDAIFKMLVDAGANVNAHDDLGLNPTWFAMQHYPDLTDFHLLLAKGVNLNADSSYAFYDPPLYAAITQHDPTLLADLLKRGASPNMLPGEHSTRWEPLELAVEQLTEKFDDQKRRDIVTMLIAAGANCNPKQDGYRVSLLYFPVMNDRIDLAKFLLDAGIDPKKDADGGKALLDALERHGSEEMKRLIRPVLAQNAHPAQQAVAVGNSAQTNAQLLEAVQKGDAAAVQKLISQGADPNKVEDHGQPLIFSAGSPAVVEILLQHGADPNARDRQTIPVLSVLLANKGAQATAIARVLLEHGADPNIRDGRAGGTPLMEAQTGDAVDLLIQHGADIHLKMTSGHGVLDMAGGRPLDYFQALLRHGVPFDVKKDGPTLLIRATWISNLPIMKEMIDQGVDPNVEAAWAVRNGKPLFMLPIKAAAIDNQLEAAKFLLAHGAKADQGMIAALHNRNDEIVKFFWENGVRNISDLSYQISQGAPVSDLAKLLDAGIPADPPQDAIITPLGEAAQLGNMEAVKLLIAHKANVNAGGKQDPKDPEYYKLTPLCLAAAEGQDEVVACLLQHGATPDPAAVYQAGYNSYPYSYQRPKDHFEKTVQILIDAGALKNIVPDMAGLVVAGPIMTRQGPPNATVLKMVLDTGASPESPMPYLEKNGEKSNTVIGHCREIYKKLKDDPIYAQTFPASAATFKPLLDMLEAADKGASASATDLNTQLLDAVQKGDAAAVQRLISQGVDPNKMEDHGRSLIFAAGNAAVAQILLQHGANPNARDSQNFPLLCDALLNKGEQATAIARVLLQHGADPNIRWTDGRTPLMAARTGDAVDLLIQHGADIHLKMPDGRGVLFAAGDGSLDYFQALLRYALPFDVQKDGPTILLRASGCSNLPMMKEMLDRGVDPNVKGVFNIWKGKPTLMLPIGAAALDDQPDAVKFLLAHGAKANAEIVTALTYRNNAIVKLFWESGVRTISELCYQISQGAPASELAKLLDAGMPADPPQDTEITPLGEAAQLGNMGAVKLLIDHKANVNAGIQNEPKAPMYEHTTPLCLAAAEGQDEIVAYLLQHGATPDPVAVHEAAFNSSPYPEQRSKDHFENTVRILIDAGALKNISPDMAGNILISPVWTRLVPPNATVLRMLLDAGLSPEAPVPWRTQMGLKPNSVIGSVREACNDPANAQSAAKLKPLLEMLEAADKGANASATDLNTQLLAAVKKGDASAVQKLINQGVDPNKVTNQGQPLIFAAGSPAVAEILLQHGANPNARDSYNDPVLRDVLLTKGVQATAIARVLLEHGADPNIRAADSGETPLMSAQDGDAVDLLIQHGADIYLDTSDGRGVLDIAGSNPLASFQALLRHGVPFDVKKDGPTILLHASFAGNLAIMQEMINRGVDPNAEGVWRDTGNGKPVLMTPMTAAEVDIQPEAAKFLLAHGAKADADMITALLTRNDKIVKLLWESGVRNISELCYQISQGAPISELVKLLDSGVPAGPPQDRKISPLGEAAQLGNLEAVKLLIARGAHVKNADDTLDPKDPQYNELLLAAREGQDEVVAYLLQHGAKPGPAAVSEAEQNSYSDPEQRSEDHFEKTIRILIDAGALKNIAPDIAGAFLARPIEPRHGPPNATVLKMMLDAGLSPESPMPHLAESGKKPNSVIGYYRELYKQRKEYPKYAEWVATFKPMLDMLEAADKGAAASSQVTPVSNSGDSTDQTDTYWGTVHNLKVSDMPLTELARQLSAMTKADDPKGAGIAIDLRVPRDEEPLKITYGDSPYTGYISNLLWQLAALYPLQYEFQDDPNSRQLVITLIQFPKVEAAFSKKAGETKIDLDFDGTDFMTSLEAIQAQAATKGFRFEINADALKGIPIPPISLKARGWSVQHAILSLCYLGNLAAEPMAGFTGYAFRPGSEAEIYDRTRIRFGIQTAFYKADDKNADSYVAAAITRPDGEMRISGPSAIMTAYPCFYRGKGVAPMGEIQTQFIYHQDPSGVNVPLEGAPYLDASFKTFATDKTHIRTAITLRIKEAGVVLRTLTGETNAPSGAILSLVIHGAPLQIDTPDNPATKSKLYVFVQSGYVDNGKREMDIEPQNLDLVSPPNTIQQVDMSDAGI